MADRSDLGVDPTRHLVVPHQPGPLISFGANRPGRSRDDLDELIDDLLPDVDELPGLFDVVLVVAGLALVGWSLLAGGPTWALVVGLIGAGLGSVLPLRSGWRRLEHRRTRRRHLESLRQGSALDVSSPEVVALEAAYVQLWAAADGLDAGLASTARSAAHGAMLEVASVLGGQSPSTQPEREYVAARSQAISDLTVALRTDDPDRTDAGANGASPELLVAARRELDELEPFNAVAQIEDLISEQRGHGQA